jgi:hypothetical protein
MESRIAQYMQCLRQLLASPQLPFDENLRGALPKQAGIYRVLERGAGGQRSVYAGQSTNLQKRIHTNHLKGRQRVSTLRRKLIKSGRCADEAAVEQYLQDECLVQFITVADKTDRMFLEHFVIAILRPEQND